MIGQAAQGLHCQTYVFCPLSNNPHSGLLFQARSKLGAFFISPGRVDFFTHHKFCKPFHFVDRKFTERTTIGRLLLSFAKGIQCLFWVNNGLNQRKSKKSHTDKPEISQTYIIWFISGLSLGQLCIITVLSMLIRGMSCTANALQISDRPGMAL